MITSKDNDKIKYLLKLHTKKYRDQFNAFLVFGDHQIEEANKNGYSLDLYTSNPNKKGELISEALMKLVSLTETPMDSLGIAKKKEEVPYSKRILMLDGIQDPGNMGTLIRSAIGFGFNTIISSLDSVDYYHERSIRATQGNLFYANLIKAPLKERIQALKFLGYKVYVTSLKKSKDIKTINPSEKCVVILGNEGSGVSQAIIDMADELVRIKTNDIESLNVAMAGTIIMYEWQV
jgi:TrmH family RNA methyltransferase